MLLMSDLTMSFTMECSDLKQSSKWKFEFTGPNQILEFILYIYI
jgi:hypothetical protein